MPQISRARFQVAAGNGGSGDVAWSNPANALVQNGSSEFWAEAALPAEQATQALDLTDPEWDHEPEEDPDGIFAEVHGYSQSTNDDLLEEEFVLRLSGSDLGTDQASGRSLGITGSDPKSHTLLYGGPTDLLGATPTAANLAHDAFGLRFRAGAPVGVADTARVGLGQLAAYWTAAPACRLERITPATQQAGQIIGVHARKSLIGDSMPEHVTITYTWTAPGGHTFETFENPVNGFGLLDIVSQEDGTKGWCQMLRTTVAGTYQVQARLKCRWNGNWVYADSNVVSFTVEAATREVRYVNPDTGDDNNDGETALTAWASLAKVRTECNGKEGWEIILADDTTLTVSGTAPVFSDVKNVRIVRSGDGIDPPIIQRGDGQIWQWGSATNLAFHGISLKGTNGTPGSEPNGLHSPSSIHCLSFSDCVIENVQSLIEGNNLTAVYLEHCVVNNFFRYVDYLGQDGTAPSGMFCANGGVWTVDPARTGEGFNRHANIANSRAFGQCATLNFVEMDGNGTLHAACRLGWDFNYIYKCKFIDATVASSHPPDGSAARGPASFVTTFHGCEMSSTDVFNLFERQGHHVCYAACIFHSWSGELATLKGTGGHCYRYSLLDCLFLVPAGNTNPIVGTQAGTACRLHGFLTKGCVVVYETALASVTAVRFFNNTTAHAWFDADAFSGNVLAKDASHREANTVHADTAAVNAQSWAVRNSVVAVEGDDCNANDGWTTSGASWDGKDAADCLFPEDMLGVPLDPAGTLKYGPRSGSVDEPTAIANWTDETPADPSWAGTWAYADRDPGEDAEPFAAEPPDNPQVLTVDTGDTTNWAESRNDGSNASTGGAALSAHANTTAGSSRIFGLRFVPTVTLEVGATIGAASLLLDAASTANDDPLVKIFYADEDGSAVFNTTTRRPSDLPKSAVSVAYEVVTAGTAGITITSSIPAGTSIQSLLQAYHDAHQIEAGKAIILLVQGKPDHSTSSLFEIMTPAEVIAPVLTIPWTDPVVIGSFALLTPTSGATGQALLPTLTWEAAENAEEYHLEVSTDVGFNTLVVDEEGILTESFTIEAPLDPNTTYFWRVTASRAGSSDVECNAAFSFSTEAVPGGGGGGTTRQATAGQAVMAGVLHMAHSVSSRR